MIPNREPCYTDRNYRDVVAWTDSGDPLVIDYHQGCLVESSGKLHADERVIQLMPATGWQVTYNAGQPDAFTEPLVAWGLRTDGSVVPLATDCHGQVDRADELTPRPLITPLAEDAQEPA